MSNFLGFEIINKSDSLGDLENKSPKESEDIDNNYNIYKDLSITIASYTTLFYLGGIYNTSIYSILNMKQLIKSIIKIDYHELSIINFYIYSLFTYIVYLFVPYLSLPLSLLIFQNILIDNWPLKYLGIEIYNRMTYTTKYIISRHITRILNLVSKRCLYHDLNFKCSEIMQIIDKLNYDESRDLIINLMIATMVYYMDTFGSNFWLYILKNYLTMSFYRKKEELEIVLRKREWEKFNDPYIITCLLTVYMDRPVLNGGKTIKNEVEKFITAWLFNTFFKDYLFIYLMWRDNLNLLALSILFFENFIIGYIVYEIISSKIAKNIVCDIIDSNIKFI